VVLLLQIHNNANNKGTSSWIGRQGPPLDLSGVKLNSPPAPLSNEVTTALFDYLQPLWDRLDTANLVSRWLYALAFVRAHSHLF
jgi:hypothetical protein